MVSELAYKWSGLPHNNFHWETSRDPEAECFGLREFCLRHYKPSTGGPFYKASKASTVASFIDVEWNPSIRLTYTGPNGWLSLPPHLPACYFPISVLLEGLSTGPYLGVKASVTLAVAVVWDDLSDYMRVAPMNWRPIWVLDPVLSGEAVHQWSGQRPGKWQLCVPPATIWDYLNFGDPRSLPHRFMFRHEHDIGVSADETREGPPKLGRMALYPLNQEPAQLSQMDWVRLVLLAVSSLFVAVFCLSALGAHERGFYLALRWAVCVISAICAGFSLCATDYNRYYLGWVAGAYAIVAYLFNPIVPPELSRGTWALLDLLTAGWFVAVSAMTVWTKIQLHQVANLLLTKAAEIEPKEGLKLAAVSQREEPLLPK